MEQLGEKKQRRVFHQLSLIFKTDNANIGLDVRHGDIVSFVEGYQRFGGNFFCIFRALELYFNHSLKLST
jgi:hypothetical protein